MAIVKVLEDEAGLPIITVEQAPDGFLVQDVDSGDDIYDSRPSPAERLKMIEANLAGRTLTERLDNLIEDRMPAEGEIVSPEALRQTLITICREVVESDEMESAKAAQKEVADAREVRQNAERLAMEDLNARLSAVADLENQVIALGGTPVTTLEEQT
jgi:hypothetical protein